MNLDAAAVSLLLFVSPGVVFFLFLSLGGRVRLIVTNQWLWLLALLVIPAYALHLLSGAIVGALTHQDTADWRLLGAFLGAAGSTSSQTSPQGIWELTRELAISCLMAAICGYVVAKLVVYRILPTSMLHGPAYPFISGYRKRITRIVVLSNVQSDGRYVLYDGFVNDWAFRSDGRLAWVSIAQPVRSLLHVGARGPAGAFTSRVSSDARNLADDSDAWGSDDFDRGYDQLTIEGEDILNYYLMGFDVFLDSKLKHWMISAVGSRPARFAARAAFAVLFFASLSLCAGAAA